MKSTMSSRIVVLLVHRMVVGRHVPVCHRRSLVGWRPPGLLRSTTPSSEMNRVAQIFLMLHLLRCCRSALAYEYLDDRPVKNSSRPGPGRLRMSGPAAAVG